MTGEQVMDDLYVKYFKKDYPQVRPNHEMLINHDGEYEFVGIDAAVKIWEKRQSALGAYKEENYPTNFPSFNERFANKDRIPEYIVYDGYFFTVPECIDYCRRHARVPECILQASDVNICLKELLGPRPMMQPRPIYTVHETKIILKKQDLWGEKVTEWKEGYIILTDDHLHYFIHYFSVKLIDEDDPKMGFSEIPVLTKSRFKIKREFVSGWGKEFAPKSKCWRIDILTTGIYIEMKVFCKLDSDAEEICNTLDEWLFKP